MAEWPFVGRAAEVAAAVEALESERGVVLVGAAGVGKSRLARSVLDGASSNGWTTMWFSAGSGSASVPFAPFAALVDEVDRDPVERLVRARRTLVEAGDRVVVAVDDAHLLDDVSTAFVRGLLLDTDVRLVLTVRTGTTSAPMWTSDLQRHEIGPLARDDVEAMIRAAVGPIDPFAVRWAYRATEGNALYVRELVTDAIERGVLVERRGRLVFGANAAEPGGRVQEVIAARIGALDDDERAALELVALAEPVGLPLLEQLASQRALHALERRGLVRSELRGRRIEARVAHPLHAEVVRSMLGTGTASSHRRRMLDALLATGARRSDDRLQVAILRMESGDISDWPSLLEAAHELSRASEAVFLADFTPQRRAEIAGSDSRELAIRLARAALIASGAAEAAVLLSWMLVRVGRPHEAKPVIASMDQLVRDDRDRVMVSRLQADAELMFTGEPHAQLDRLKLVEDEVEDIVLKLKARSTRASVLGLLGDARKSHELARSVYEDERAEIGDRLTCAGLVASALGPRGRTSEAFALLDEAQTLVGPEADSQGLAVLMIARILLLAVEGRLAEMEQLCLFGLAVSDQVGSEDGVAVFSAINAQGAVGSGKASTALTHANHALRRMVDTDPLGIRVLALTARVLALAYMGDADGVAVALDDLLVEPRTGVFSTSMQRSKGWAEVAMGRIVAARATLEGAVEEALADDRSAQAIAVLHDLARLGVRGLLPRVEEVSAKVDGPYAPLVLEHVRGLDGDDAALLEAAAAGHEAMGAHLYAAECWAQAAGAHRRAGRKSAANDAAGRSRSALAQCDGPPATPALVEREPLGALTRREQEIVALAGSGLSDKDIAEQLVVSVRTVQTHLYNSYAKLGIDGREGLTDY